MKPFHKSLICIAALLIMSAALFGLSIGMTHLLSFLGVSQDIIAILMIFIGLPAGSGMAIVLMLLWDALD